MLAASLIACAAVSALYAVRRADRDAWHLCALLAYLGLSLVAQRAIPLTSVVGIWTAHALLFGRMVALPVTAAIVLARTRPLATALVGAASVAMMLALLQRYGADLDIERLDIAASAVSAALALWWMYRGRGEHSASRLSVMGMVALDAVVAIGSLGSYQGAAAWADRGNAYLMGCVVILALLFRGLKCRR